MLDGADDPFKTAELRGRVLDAWAASAARFREDANAEEDYALGGYRDRVVVELAQNAADAAARAGVPGRLRLTLRDGILVASNTGAPLDAAGVEALSTLRASSKRGQDAVGRFGVGFAAVVAVSDAPRMSSVTGSVQWSREDTRELVRQVPALAGELAERSGHVPVLRLPFPADGTAPDGFATAVTLPLRDSGARELAERLLAQAGPALLLALPALSSIEIEAGGTTRVLTAARDGDDITITVDGSATRWRTATAGGRLAPGLLADRPSEERTRTSWSVCWAVPVTGPREPGGPRSRPGGCPAGSIPWYTRRPRPTSRWRFPRCCSRRSRSARTGGMSRRARSLTSSPAAPPRFTPGCCPASRRDPRCSTWSPGRPGAASSTRALGARSGSGCRRCPSCRRRPRCGRAGAPA